MTVGIVGIGLIGGSFAKSLKANSGHRVLGTDTNPDTMAMAKMSGAVDEELDEDGFRSCDVVLAALSPAAMVGWAERNAEHLKGTVLVDLCGVKRELCPKLTRIAESGGFFYVGGHPMAGREVCGFWNASADLFKGASMILTPDGRTDIGVLDMLRELFLTAGFRKITFAVPEIHDEIIACTSQLPHVISSAFVKSPTALRHTGFSAGSFRDMSRVSALDEDLWTELFLMNSENLTKELELFVQNLAEYLDAVKNKDADRLRALLREGRECKAAIGGV